MDKRKKQRFAFSRQSEKGQEEMVGFALIVIIVAIIIIIFLGLSLAKKPATTQSYETENFMQAMLQYTTNCTDSSGYVSVKNLIFECASGMGCINGPGSCEVLNSTVKNLLKAGWSAGNDSLVKGYSFDIISNSGVLASLKVGESTKSSQGSTQSFSQGATMANITLEIYN